MLTLFLHDHPPGRLFAAIGLALVVSACGATPVDDDNAAAPPTAAAIADAQNAAAAADAGVPVTEETPAAVPINPDSLANQAAQDAAGSLATEQAELERTSPASFSAPLVTPMPMVVSPPPSAPPQTSAQPPVASDEVPTAD